jgi:aminopeptidase N
MSISKSLAALFLVALVAFADTYPRQLSVDALHYIFRLTLSDANDEITGEATADLRFLSAGLTEFSLDLASAHDGKGMTVSEVTSAGATVQYRHRDDRLTFTLPTPTKAGERRQFTIKYHGIPASGLWASPNAHGDRGIFSANWPNLAHQWLPIIDHPYDKATSEFIITAPSKYQVAANGLLQEELDLGNGMRLTHWKQSVPIASWLNAIAVAQFSARQLGIVAGVPLSVWVPYQDREAGIASFDLPARQALEFFSDHIGPFPYEKLANVWASSPGFRGGTEHASVIFYGCCKSGPNVVWHEIAHQWFGDSITEKDWDDVWLSEGFATYFTLLTSEHYQGRDAFVTGLQNARTRIYALEKTLPGIAVTHNNLSDMSKVLNRIIYEKGGWTLHMLRAQIGTDKFWEGIRDYYRRYRDSSASTEDFRKVMEETSGQDLRWFFQQWLYRSPSPAIEGIWHFNEANRTVQIDLTQTQTGDAYRLPLEIALAAKTVKIEMTQKQQHFDLPVEQDPATVTLDPNTLVLMDAHFSKAKE